MSFLFGVIAASYDTSVPPTPPPPPPPPTCTPVCADPISSTSDGPYSDPAWSTCVDGVQTRTNSFVRSTTVTQTCTASDCSTFTTSNTTTETIYVPQSQACGVTWYCTTAYGGRYTSSTDVSFTGECSETVACSTSGYPSNPPC
jgi:hypothetical protein